MVVFFLAYYLVFLSPRRDGCARARGHGGLSLFLCLRADFEGRLNARQSELLVQYLTVPYLRIPLVATLLSDESRVRALASVDLQGVLDSVLFEPGPWLAPPPAFGAPHPLPTTVPAQSRAHLATPLGLLFNELLRSPDTLLRAIERLVDTAVEMDTGR